MLVNIRLKVNFYTALVHPSGFGYFAAQILDMNYKPGKFLWLLIVITFIFSDVDAQYKQREVNWTADGEYYLRVKDGGIVKVNPATNAEESIISKSVLTPEGSSKPLAVAAYSFSSDNKKLLVFTNTAKVWRYNTRGDYWVLDIDSKKLTQLGKGRPSQSLMFAKFSPVAGTTPILTAEGDSPTFGYSTGITLEYTESVVFNI